MINLQHCRQRRVNRVLNLLFVDAKQRGNKRFQLYLTLYLLYSPCEHPDAGLLVPGLAPIVLHHLLDQLAPLLVQLLRLLLEMVPPAVPQLSRPLLIAPANTWNKNICFDKKIFILLSPGNIWNENIYPSHFGSLLSFFQLSNQHCSARNTKTQ